MWGHRRSLKSSAPARFSVLHVGNVFLFVSQEIFAEYFLHILLHSNFKAYLWFSEKQNDTHMLFPAFISSPNASRYTQIRNDSVEVQFDHNYANFKGKIKSFLSFFSGLWIIRICRLWFWTFIISPHVIFISAGTFSSEKGWICVSVIPY